jgi:hypothetical protein
VLWSSMQMLCETAQHEIHIKVYYGSMRLWLAMQCYYSTVQLNLILLMNLLWEPPQRRTC